MTTPGDRPRRSGFLSNLSSALTPPIITDDDPDEPLVTPTPVRVATALAILAGIMLVMVGAVNFVNRAEILETQVEGYHQALKQCDEVGGIGDKVVIPEDADEQQKQLGEACKQAMPEVTQEVRDNFLSSSIQRSIPTVIIGLLAIGFGWFLTKGAMWARRGLIATLIGQMIMSMLLSSQVLFALLGISEIFAMIPTLFLVVAVLVCYLGKGGVFFARTALRRKNA